MKDAYILKILKISLKLKKINGRKRWNLGINFNCRYKLKLSTPAETSSYVNYIYMIQVQEEAS